MATRSSAAGPVLATDGGSPASRASWSGVLQLSRRAAPVKAYPATVAAPAGPLRQLHLGCGRRVQQRKWCPEHGPVPDDQAAKGYEYAPDDYVTLTEEELERLRPADDKTLDLRWFCDPRQLDLTLLSGRSLYLAPAHAAAASEYALLLHGLREAAVWGLALMVLSGHRQPVAVRPAAGQLVLHVLHWPAQCRRGPCSPEATAHVPREQVRQLAAEIRRGAGAVPWGEFVDDSEARLAQLVQGKVAARRNDAAPADGQGASARPRREEPRRAARRTTPSPGPRKAA